MEAKYKVGDYLYDTRDGDILKIYRVYQSTATDVFNYSVQIVRSSITDKFPTIKYFAVRIEDFDSNPNIERIDPKVAKLLYG